MLKLCGMQALQELPLRGHKDSNTAKPGTNRGVFIGILEHDSNSDSTLSKHFEASKCNQKYTSNRIQNEIVGIIHSHLCEEVNRPLRQGRYFSIMADEVADSHANQEMLSLCVRFVNLSGSIPHVRKAFLNFIHLERATAKRIAEAIQSLLTKHGLGLKDIHGQSYDRA